MVISEHTAVVRPRASPTMRSCAWILGVNVASVRQRPMIGLTDALFPALPYAHVSEPRLARPGIMFMHRSVCSFFNDVSHGLLRLIQRHIFRVGGASHWDWVQQSRRANGSGAVDTGYSTGHREFCLRIKYQVPGIPGISHCKNYLTLIILSEIVGAYNSINPSRFLATETHTTKDTTCGKTDNGQETK